MGLVLALSAARVVLRKPKYSGLFLVLAGAFFWLLVAVPVKTIPGNTFAFQLEVLTITDYLLLISLSILSSLLAIFHIYLRQRDSAVSGLRLAGQTGVGGVSGVAASVFGTATCGACISAIFGFLGFGSVLFLLDFRWYIVSGAIILTVISLYFAVRKVNGACEACAGKNVISGY